MTDKKGIKQSKNFKSKSLSKLKKHKTTPKKSNINKKDKKQLNIRSKSHKVKLNTQKGGDSVSCKRNINETLTNNTQIYTYNNSGADGKGISEHVSALGSSTTTDWGSNPGSPPDPSGCIIL